MSVAGFFLYRIFGSSRKKQYFCGPNKHDWSMSILEIWFLAVALAMDCFSVSIASGTILRSLQWKHILRMALMFGLFQALMPCIGWALTEHFHNLLEQFDHWIAFALLGYLGIGMIREDLSEKDEKEVKSFDPTRLRVVITLAIATSIDALAVGISFVCTGLRAWSDILFPVTAIGITSFLLSIAGHLIGVGFGKKFTFKAELVGGIVLICIGLKILLTHLTGGG